MQPTVIHLFQYFQVFQFANLILSGDVGFESGLNVRQEINPGYYSSFYSEMYPCHRSEVQESCLLCHWLLDKSVQALFHLPV